MKKKEKYTEAEINVVLLQSSDVISTSSLGGEEPGLDEDGWA